MPDQQDVRSLADYGYDPTSYAVSDLGGMTVDLTYVELVDSDENGPGAMMQGTVYIAIPGFNAGDTIKIRAFSRRPREAAEALVGNEPGGKVSLHPPVRVGIQKQGRSVVLV